MFPVSLRGWEEPSPEGRSAPYADCGRRHLYSGPGTLVWLLQARFACCGVVIRLRGRDTRRRKGVHAPPVPVFFLSDSTGISAETMGNALLIQFPDLVFERRLIPFITSADEARK